ncbi:hypothetical protein ORS3428_25115 [Mesorhizobium sp. ORS 3428]|nr:hypothetical protein ORS3428_25115 [Mesorhizobium sp. ORS 3428]
MVNLPEKEQEEIHDKAAQQLPVLATHFSRGNNKQPNVPQIIATGRPTQRSFLQPLQEWEGYVVTISKETFTARLLDVTAGSEIEEEQVEFIKDDLSDTDLTLLHVGAVFRWVIGYHRDPGGSKRRVSQIVFRRLPAWTKMDLLSARQRALELKSALVWED